MTLMLSTALLIDGAYRLPDGTEVVVGAKGKGRYFLYRRTDWTGKIWVLSLPVAFEVSADGSIITGSGKATFWTSADLSYQGYASRS
jgi:hypothetical protein